ncbi:MAG: CRISPR-associated protein Csm4 [Treponema sp.]|jgi:CRISPR-associated protein Csm4|nr:CRISPR-associated protein Csm4 [Treponema sp.]
MTLYRIRFKLCSAIVTPLKGDTIWGHIVWGIANHEGNAAVSEFLEQEKSAPPALVVSSAFPAGMVCRPLPPPPKRDDSLNIDTYSEIKKKKKEKYVPSSEYLSGMEAAAELKENTYKNAQVMQMHNTIDRAANIVLEGGLYSTEEIWPGIKDGDSYILLKDWDLFILSSLKPERVKHLVEWAFENGYGADASTGKGRISVIGDPVPVKPGKQGNTYMALGPFVDSKNGIDHLRADIFIRSGKLGGAFAASLSPYKKPVVLYDEGAVFTCEKPIEYTGMLLEKMHGSEEFNICQSGFAPVIPVD